MKNKSLLLLIIQIFIVNALDAHANADENKTDTILDFTLGSYRYQANYSSGFALGTGGASLGLSRVLTKNLEITLRAAYSILSSTPLNPGTTKLTLTLGPTFDIPVDEKGAKNSFFLSLTFGINYGDLSQFAIPGTDYTSQEQANIAFAYELDVGKRFLLVPNVSWVPSISVSGFNGADIFNGDLISSPCYRVIPIKFAIFI